MGEDLSFGPVALVLEPRERDLGDGFFVRRVLPAGKRRAVGPFVFFDHFGPTTLLPGRGLDVRPHPHVNLATVTYLYEGEIDHRDSLGSLQTIRPGDINWMTAGRGIVHSERTPPERCARAAPACTGCSSGSACRASTRRPRSAFHHHAGESLPVVRQAGVVVRVLAGEAFGARSPVATLSRLVYLDVKLYAGAAVELPDTLGDRGAYAIEGDLRVVRRSRLYAPARMLFLGRSGAVHLATERGARFVVVGGEPFPEPRHLWWNFASSSEERIDQAKRDWLTRRGEPGGPFPLVPGDEEEFIPIAE